MRHNLHYITVARVSGINYTKKTGLKKEASKERSVRIQVQDDGGMAGGGEGGDK